MLNSTWKNGLLGVHLILFSVWIGTLTVMLLFILNGNTESLSTWNKMIFLLSDIIVMNVSLAVAFTGLIFSLFTNWGFFRFYWIMVKWAVIVILAVIIVFYLGPAVNGMAALADIYGGRASGMAEFQQFQSRSILWIVMQFVLLGFVVFLSVYKPWGQRKPRRTINRKLVLSVGVVLGFGLIASFLMQQLSLKHFRNIKIDEVRLDTIENGYYTAGIDYGYHYEVGVEVKDHRISKVDILQNRDSQYARLAEGVKNKVLEQQKVNVDGVTGATTTSKVLLLAIRKALDKSSNR